MPQFAFVSTPLMIRRSVLLALCALLLVASACKRDTTIAVGSSTELAYASEARGEVRDQLGPKSKVIANTTSGQQLEILERLNRWARVRVVDGSSTAGKPPLEGWMHQRQMVSEEVYRQFQTLGAKSRELPSQGSGVIRRLANMRLEPGRSTQPFYQLAPDETFEVLQHASASRPATAEEVRNGNTEPIPEDWLLVRATGGRTGWILESLAELVPPLDVARYRESQRIRGWFELYREESQGQVHPWILWATVPKLSGDAHDFEEIRVFVWNPAASRYETSYREKNLKGFLPMRVETVNAGSGPTPAFSFDYLNADGVRLRRNYIMTGRQVRLQK